MLKMSQKGVVLYANGRQLTEVDVQQPSGEPGAVHAPDYRDNLPGADPEHLLAADCPFSHLAGTRVLVLYDANSAGRVNACASRLTTNVATGEQIEIKGDALALYASPGEDFGTSQWEELDNVIYDELLEYFGQGLKPQAKDLRRLVEDFKAGKFRYETVVGENQPNGEDVNKDDGGENLPGWG